MKDDSFDCTLIAHLRIFLLFCRLLYCLILPENRLFFGIWKVVEIEVSIMANVGVEKVVDVFQHFIAMYDEPLFFILELPVTCDREALIAPGVVEETHKDVYYIDGCTQEECLVLLEKYGELLVNDGMNRFGFGCHESGDEIMLDKYNVVTIYSRTLSKYNDFFEAHEINRVSRLVTAWDTFSDDTPGQAERYDYNGKSVYDLPDVLKDWGIYLAETRAE